MSSHREIGYKKKVMGKVIADKIVVQKIYIKVYENESLINYFCD